MAFGQIMVGKKKSMTYSELALIRTPEMWPLLYSGQSEKSQVCFIVQIHP